MINCIPAVRVNIGLKLCETLLASQLLWDKLSCSRFTFGGGAHLGSRRYIWCTRGLLNGEEGGLSIDAADYGRIDWRTDATGEAWTEIDAYLIRTRHSQPQITALIPLCPWDIYAGTTYVLDPTEHVMKLQFAISLLRLALSWTHYECGRKEGRKILRCG